MSICNEIQQKIAELGINQNLVNKEDLKHIESCQVCQEYQQDCHDMNLALSAMAEYDADEALVESTLNSILSLQAETKKPRSLLSSQWASGLAACFMLISLIALFPYNSISNFGLFSDTHNSPESVVMVSEQEKQNIRQRKEALSKNKQDNNSIEFFEVDVAEEVHSKQRRIPKKPAPPSSQQIIDELRAGSYLGAADVSSLEDSDTDSIRESLEKTIQEGFKKEAKKELGNLAGDRSPRPLESSDRLAFNDPDFAKDQDTNQRQDGSVVGRVEEDSVLEIIPEAESSNDIALTNSDYDTRKKLNENIKQSIDQGRKEMRDNANLNDNKQDVLLDKVTVTGSRIKRESVDDKVVADAKKGSDVKFTIDSSNSSTTDGNSLENIDIINTPVPLSPAKKFLTQLNSLDNVTYQTSSGYWANNYLPGDANMRLLAGSLLKDEIDIESIVEQNRQPFDYPTNSALEVYLSSDHAHVNAQQPTRMRLQVGIQASNRKGGHRSAMNIGLVFDVSEYNTESIDKIKALLLALLKDKQASDKISVSFTGINGEHNDGILIKANEFRYGTIQAAMNSLASVSASSDNVTLSLHQVIKLASVNLQKDDDPSASLGSSVVMLVTDKNMDDISAIETTIHENAVNGITLSTVSLADDNHQQLNQLALAGQGHARVLKNTNDAKRVIEEEILASSRAVARALRLRIRLANGVKLIKVLDSYNLNESQAQRVRDAENSLDQRLSKNLGIQADRGEDEEGIQMVIPSFYAGDTHVVILDVVVNNPGAIADVSMRYKDLLYLRNAVTRKQLNLDDDAKPIGPLQLNVLKNILASRFTDEIKKASLAVKNGDELRALSLLSKLLELYQSMRSEFPVWNNDAEILKDEKLIQQYIELINQTSKNDDPQVDFIVDSLQYISWRKNITQSK